DLNLVRRHADRVCVLQHGIVQESGPVADVFHSPQSAYTKELLGAEPGGRPSAIKGSAPLLIAKSLGVQFQRPKRLFQRRPPAFEALSPIDLSVAPGETLGIVGESGSGKTTLALALLRLITSKGEINFDGT